MRMLKIISSAITLACLAPGSSFAAERDASGEDDGSSAAEDSEQQQDTLWIDRWAPERNMVELGVFGGVALPSRSLELFEPIVGVPGQGFRTVNRAAFDGGGRLGFYPARFLGLEAEGALIPTRTTGDEQRALLWAVRGHLVAQYPRWSVVPFVLAGPTMLGTRSAREALGNDIDAGFHFGGGLKIFVSRSVLLRFDVRDTLTAQQGIGDGAGHTVELLAGLSISLNRKKQQPQSAPQDRDRDGDGTLDRDDRCIDTPGPKSNRGCPVADRDADGILNEDDRCPDTPGIPENFGCPVADQDGDGILDGNDACVEDPENKNGYEDEDGCPDEIPLAVQEFTGVIDGIFFDTNRATIKDQSIEKLDRAVAVLTEYPSVRLEVSGHTDARGTATHNADLSTRRAESVRDYLAGHGVDSSRLQVFGAGEGEPRASNLTADGRAMNRRIEFRITKN